MRVNMAPHSAGVELRRWGRAVKTRNATSVVYATHSWRARHGGADAGWISLYGGWRDQPRWQPCQTDTLGLVAAALYEHIRTAIARVRRNYNSRVHAVANSGKTRPGV